MENKREDYVLDDSVQPFCAQTTDFAPSFIAEAYDNVAKKFKEVNLESYRGKWVILFFYPSNFTFV
ncbi:alkyl hydroperoxide reductase [Neobacillus cucumis]|uniref:Alkyl hydroperoxide reductase n=2 Tax=Neobacillus cucumis TaxID=1740721 RepID=A0A2N5H8K4_9BACI|nr:alkyl hydroperoxide reductase [Neobacillus cucumis]